MVIVEISWEVVFFDLFDYFEVFPILFVLASRSRYVLDASNLAFVVVVGSVDPESVLYCVSFIARTS